MMSELDCGSDAGAYALGAMDEAEAAVFQRHLATCAACREEVELLRGAAAVLPLSVPQIDPPRQLRKRVMAEVRADARARRAVADAGASARPGRRWLAGPVGRPAFAALALLLVAAVVALGVSRGSGGARVIHATTAWRTAEASVRVQNDRGELFVRGMPAPPAGKVYEVWIQRGAHGAPIATDALFGVTARGQAVTAVPVSLRGVTAVMVTAEPAGGSAHPTSTPVIVAKMA